MTPSDDPGFAIYLHWPFCAAKCPYCDFNSHVRHQGVDQSRYVAAFEREIGHFAELTQGRTVRSIFLGGGTPSLMDPTTVEAILGMVAKHWSIEDGAEISMEANPSSVEAERFRGYRAAGVNRVSLGVQALNDADLRMLGRLHDTQTALKAIETARETFPRLSFDLIYARPDQAPEAWAKELARAIDLAADHLSLYQLTIEQGTPFYMLHKAGKLIVPDPDAAADLYEVTQEICDSAGMSAYEISNHAAPGAQCQHNLVYWRYGDYLGIGPGAHGRMTLGDARFATEIERHPETWLDQVAAKGHGPAGSNAAHRRRAGRRIPDHGPAPRRRHRYSALRADVRPLAGPRSPVGADRARHGRNGGEFRVRATRDGFYVLDAVVADLAS